MSINELATKTRPKGGRGGLLLVHVPCTATGSALDKATRGSTRPSNMSAMLGEVLWSKDLPLAPTHVYGIGTFVVKRHMALHTL